MAILLIKAMSNKRIPFHKGKCTIISFSLFSCENIAFHIVLVKSLTMANCLAHLDGLTLHFSSASSVAVVYGTH